MSLVVFRKNWSQCYVATTGQMLYFYKDQKAANPVSISTCLHLLRLIQVFRGKIHAICGVSWQKQ